MKAIAFSAYGHAYDMFVSKVHGSLPFRIMALLLVEGVSCDCTSATNVAV